MKECIIIMTISTLYGSEGQAENYGDGSKNYTAHNGMHSAPNVCISSWYGYEYRPGTFMEYTTLYIKALNPFGSSIIKKGNGTTNKSTTPRTALFFPRKNKELPWVSRDRERYEQGKMSYKRPQLVSSNT